MSNGAAALSDIRDGLDDFRDILRDALAPVPSVAPAAFESSPERMTRAIGRAQKSEKWLGTAGLVDFLQIIQRDRLAATAYLALDIDDPESDDVRKEWIQRTIAGCSTSS